MGVYRARDLIRVPGLLSLSRLPLAAAFPFVLERPVSALAILFAAALSDVLDGWYARRFGEVTATGTALDPVTDKLFVLTVAVSLTVAGRLSPTDVLALSTREIAELPLVVWIATSSHARQLRAANATANTPGKMATVLQFATATAALFRMPHLTWMIATTSVVGLAAAATYWLRALREGRIHAVSSRSEGAPGERPRSA
jgi:CDP-diacylglycerol--glycerol-3-phosphate 3-phosphatidyltransferase/cardiolipin synthase